MKKNKLVIVILLVLFSNAVYASGLLNIIPDTRSLGMGCVNNGISSGVSALILNPAGIIGIRNYEVSYSHLFWPYKGLDFSGNLAVQYEYIGFVKKIKKNFIGANFAHYYQPKFNYEGCSYSIFSGFTSITYAYDFYHFIAGIRMKVLWEVLGDYNSGSIAFDIGLSRSFNFLKLYKSTEPNFKIGFSIFNMGKPLRLYSEQESLPASIQLGYSYKFFDGSRGCLLMANDLKYFFGDNGLYRFFEINCGLEYLFLNYFNINCGYILDIPVASPSFTHRVNNKFSAGLGGKYTRTHFTFHLRYALMIVMQKRKLYTHSISFTFRRKNYFENKKK